MRILAMEQSTPESSLALLDDTRVLAEHQWTEGRARDHRLFEELPGFLKSVSIGIPDIDMFAAGLGPGSFSGLRIALTAAQAFALPLGRRVIGIPSATALAWELAADRPDTHITIIGDARRQRLWLTTFTLRDGRIQSERALGLVSRDEVRTAIPEGATVATPDWERIGETLTAALPVNAVLLPGPRAPHAAAVGQLARAEIETPNGEGTDDPLSPIYLHPAVS